MRIRLLMKALTAAGAVGVVLLTLALAEPASAKPGYSCSPFPPGHPNVSGCHVTVTTAAPTTAAPTTAAPTTAPPTTAAPAPVTTNSATASGSQSVSGTTLAPEESTTTAQGPTTTVEASTTTTGSDTGILGTSDAGTSDTGTGRRIAIVWLTALGSLAAVALLAFAGLGVKRSRDRRLSQTVLLSAAGPVRFVLAERLAHWFYALCFVAAGTTGALMWIPLTERWMAEAEYTVSKYHGYVGLAMVFVPFIIFLILDRKRLAQNRRELDSWSANDRRWLWQALSGGMFRGKKMPPQGRFNAGQKVNTHLVGALAIGFVITGVLLLVRLHLPGWLVSGTRFAHQVIAVTSVVLLLGHIGMALLTKHGRVGLGAMINGIMPARIAREGHFLWYVEWRRQYAAKRTVPAGEETGS